mgnify:CR=1 FL=1
MHFCAYSAISKFTFHVIDCELKLKCVIIFCLQESNVYICTRNQLLYVFG